MIQSQKVQSGAKMAQLGAAPKAPYTFVKTYLGNLRLKFETSVTNTVVALGF